MMIKTLTKGGNSYALVIEKPILELLHATPDTPFEIISDGRSLVLKPVRSSEEAKKYGEAVAVVHKRFGKAMRRLAEQTVPTPLFLNIEPIMRLPISMIERYGGTEGTRDVGLLPSAVAMPQRAYGSEYLHANIFEMARPTCTISSRTTHFLTETREPVPGSGTQTSRKPTRSDGTVRRSPHLSVRFEPYRSALATQVPLSE